jgi:filamentous hemagglutinin family protein
MNKRAGRTNLRANHIAIAVAAAFAPWSLHAQTPPAPHTLPTGGVITHGSGTINAPVYTPTVSTMQIDQTSARMAAQFGSFSIGESAHVNVSQPTSSSIALFKDVGGSVSQIYGRLTANGQLFVSNPNGVLIGRTGRVEAAGFIASTLTLDENEFMLGGNSFNWVNNDPHAHRLHHARRPAGAQRRAHHREPRLGGARGGRWRRTRFNW